MQKTIVGVAQIRKGNSKKTNAPYHGQTLYLTHKEPDVDGLVTSYQYMDFLNVSEPLPVFKAGDLINFDFNDKGYLISWKKM